ncbi:MAG: amidase domain-containing protein [Oscillospiraceae bacterium]|nr:amidase domain-containing protein [Oscillospiraceae bacterium]
MNVVPYRRQAALQYAERWALSRNPAYADFSGMGGDCTNFLSQCLFAGSGVMNWEPVFGWYYRSLSDRAPAWTGVDELFRFLTQNTGAGPFGERCAPESLMPGDLIQLEQRNRGYYHSLLVIRSGRNPLVAAHDFDVWMRPLMEYGFWGMRCIHIRGVRR